MLTLEDNGYYNFNGVSLKATSDILLQMAFQLTSEVKQLLYTSRVFLGFLYENKYTEANLKTAVPKLVAPWRKLHEGFTDAEIIELLNSVDLGTPIGKRDYAILVLAAQTGLRAVDIANLKKSDIDWRNKEIRIVQHKTGNVLGLPLEPESGNAIADYPLNVRPECNSKAVFISARHPYRPLEAASLHTLVRSRIQKTSFAGTTKP
jgi:integrase/recombinase XerD